MTHPFPLVIVILAAVLVLTAVRQLVRIRVPIWLIMLAGAAAALAFRQISPRDALRAVNLDVVLFLFGMFVIGRALEESGLLHSLGMPGQRHEPDRHSQNLVIAIGGGVGDPFLTFFARLALPTIVSLLLTWLALRLAFPKEFHDGELTHANEPLRDPALARLTSVSLGVVGAASLLAGSRRRVELFLKIDWSTLLFFAALFILMQAVWQSDFLQSMIDLRDSASVPRMLGLSILGSQIVSNVPFVALSLPLLGHAVGPTPILLALAAGSTIAGNCLVLGAASNVIIIQAAETSGSTISFFTFARVGIPLTIAQTAVYAVSLSLLR